MTDPILDGLQAATDRDRPGWNVAMYVAVVGLNRLTDDGLIENTISLYTPDGQHPCSTDGLLGRGAVLHECVEADVDDE